MIDDVDDLLHEMTRLTSAPDEAQDVLDRWTQDPARAERAKEAAELWSALAVDLAPVAPSASVKTRLFASLEKEQHAPFAAELARLCDLALEKMQTVLQKITDPSAWEAGPLAGVTLIHFDHGPACVGADTGLVKMAPGLAFPRHRHHGPEINYILEGQLTDDDGTVYKPGDALRKFEGQPHGFTVGDEGLVMVVIHNGFDIEAG